MASVNMSIRVDPELKAQAEALFDELGLTMNGAINMFLKQSVRDRAVPLSLSLGGSYPPSVYEALEQAERDRAAGLAGHDAWEVAREMEEIIAKAEADRAADRQRRGA